MKKIKKFILLVIALVAVMAFCTACGEDEEDYEHAKNPEDYVKECLKEIYDSDAVIVDTHVIDEKEQITVFDVYLEDNPDKIFQAQAYWYVSDAIPTRHFRVIDNYKGENEEIYDWKKNSQE